MFVKMKWLLFPSVVLLSVCYGAIAQESEGRFYDTRYDYLDLDAILDSKRLVRNYVDCLLNQRPCTPEGKALKRILPEALRTKCSRCTPRQKHNALIVLRKLRDNYPEEWQRLGAKWDPSGDFAKRFEDYLDRDDNNAVDKPTNNASRPKPTVVNRFGQDNGGQGASSDVQPTVQPPPSTTINYMTTPMMSTTMRVTRSRYTQIPVTSRPPEQPTTVRNVQNTFRPAQTTVRRQTTMRPVRTTVRSAQTTARQRPNTVRYPEYRPVNFQPIYEGTMGLIDHFGSKIIKTTEIVTDILKNTVRAVVGR